MGLGVLLGAPNIISIMDRTQTQLGQVKMDVCAFVGVAPKGPSRRHQVFAHEPLDLQSIADNWLQRDRTVALKVTSWEQFRRLYGGFESPGRLVYAVANFFEQGGQEAYICRIVHEYEDDAVNLDAVASCMLTNLKADGSSIGLTAKNEGVWGNQLSAAAGISLTPIEFLVDKSSINSICFASTQGLERGGLLRLVNDDTSNPGTQYSEYRFIHQFIRQGDDLTASEYWKLDFSSAPLLSVPTKIEWVEGQLSIVDKATGISEEFANLGLSPSHPRFMGRVLLTDSNLVDPQIDWLLSEIYPQSLDPFNQNLFSLNSVSQLAINPSAFAGGEDRYQDITHSDFFDKRWVLGDEHFGSGVHCLSNLKDCSVLVVPDLYAPEPFEKVDHNLAPELFSGADFAPCIEEQTVTLEVEKALPSLPKLRLDPQDPLDRDVIIRLQQGLESFASQMREFVVLLDVPPAQTPEQITQWRSKFSSEYCAAYHPWLKVNEYNADGQVGDSPKIINPSAVAAGVIAASELQYGLTHGPANRLAKSVFSLQIKVSDSFHDQLHPLGINVFVQQRDGIWLSGARSISHQRKWRQLSVVRLMVMLRRVLLEQMQWVVFEPNTPALWVDVKFKLQSFLKQLFVAGAFKGSTPEQAYFVRCDESLNSPQVIDSGRLVAHIGVAPAEPLEYLILQFSREADGSLKMVSK
ncbi:phage tail sheath subtilisin-like domain-containing protein [Aliiglaciecola sp. 3_MG-2023]|uniref:phage tail sheath family protein n=1 Tax=Aliiglaciecola sp. 3_MG-2023 TaxID=3062644 RepID=UPI0026E24795|nr:phage tail sheath C-terminal domain-containing protein [Aliiglaciecola sp. 3_MG-2023]MDO6693761.1 phage tail sheath subtilisin-like domain-containing protein [Aliiglaciecola sp. 3_MG-2023]